MPVLHYDPCSDSAEVMAAYQKAKQSTNTFGHLGNTPPSSNNNKGSNRKYRKTEICKNWLNGHCQYGENCSFAHGKRELKKISLDELEQSGRIPKADKFRCYPCHTWISTGACPYGSRCVFVHDPRVKGNSTATYTAAQSSKKTPKAAVRDIFYWPDMLQQHNENKEEDVPTVDIEYHFQPEIPRYNSMKYKASGAYNLWNSFLATISPHQTPQFHTTDNKTTHHQHDSLLVTGPASNNHSLMSRFNSTNGTGDVAKKESSVLPIFRFLRTNNYSE